MSSRVLLSRILRCGVSCTSIRQQPIQNFTSRFHSVIECCRPASLTKGAPLEVSQLFPQPFLTNITNQRFGFSTSASAEPATKDSTRSHNSSNASGTEEANGSAASTTETHTDASKTSDEVEDTGVGSNSENTRSQYLKKRRKKSTKRTAFSDSDTEPDLSFDDLKKLVAEKEELLKLKEKEIEKMQDKVLRSYAETENVLERTKREAENSKKFAIQNFAKSLLDVADNLERASSVVKESFSKIDSSKDSVGAVPLLKTLLEGVEMTEKQLSEVFRKCGVEKFDPVNEHFDPNRHYAVFQIPDASKEPGTVAAVLKPGYMLYDRVLRPAEVGVVEAVNNETE